MIYLVIFLSLVAIAELVALLWLHTSVYEGEVNGHPFVFHPLKKKEVGEFIRDIYVFAVKDSSEEVINILKDKGGDIVKESFERDGVIDKALQVAWDKGRDKGFNEAITITATNYFPLKDDKHPN